MSQAVLEPLSASWSQPAWSSGCPTGTHCTPPKLHNDLVKQHPVCSVHLTYLLPGGSNFSGQTFPSFFGHDGFANSKFTIKLNTVSSFPPTPSSGPGVDQQQHDGPNRSDHSSSSEHCEES